ncbi:MAG: 50S ribosomal protein L6 [Bacteroidetes bacterium SW_11_45_7]|nr:MAG: 50S ribosomal protein L6 [Bacteroidetes bacterium SW_11_45_7]
MSRIGTTPINLPDKVEVEVGKNNYVTAKGPKGELAKSLHPDMNIDIADGQVHVARPSESKHHKSLHGLTRSLLYNLVVGVSEGYERRLELVGVGYRASVDGQNLELIVGYSHPVLIQIPSEVSVSTEQKKGENPTVILGSIDKEMIGHVTAKIRSIRPPEPYKGKGIRIVGEYIRTKAGKAGG